MVVVATDPQETPHFAVGQGIHLRRFEGAHAYVVEGPQAYSSGWQYRVVLEGSTDGPAWQAEHQLTPCPEGQTRWRTPDEFRRDLLLAKLRLRLSDTLYTYRASRTLFEPYQFRPVLRFLASQRQRLLIADEVGLGKTIEAAMIYLELKARLGSELKRVLIVCPSRLRAKWQDELRSRFDEEFQDLGSTQAVRSLLNRWRDYGDAYRFRAIVSYELLRSESLARDWAEMGIRLDLLIADEAHVMRNTTSLTHELGQILTDNADAAIFLTATPLMLGNPDLFNLLQLLAPEDYDDFRSFPEQVRPNEYVNLAAREIGAGDPRTALDRLRWVEMTVMRDRFLKDPSYQETVERLRTLVRAGSPPSRDDTVRLQRQILELNTLSAIFTRTRKREVANAKPRRAFTFPVTLSPAERLFYDAFLAQVRRDLRQANGGAASFAIVMRERMAASCLASTRQAIEDSFKQRMEASLQVERSEFHLSAEDDDERQQQAERLRSTGELLALSRQIGDADAKFDLFEQTLRARLAQKDTSKALVFSYFRGTLQYLLNRLRNLGYSVGVIHGGISIDERQKTIEKFRTDPNFRVLLSSEVGAEGLDFQFCDVLVNYDLPWNPMQVEQRIGRLDRFGQEAEQITIYNFVIEDSVETRIFERLYDRINIFERSIGDLEAILGEEIRKLSLDVIRADLTPEQEIEEAERSAQRIVALQQAREELERQQDELVGQGAILDAAVQDAVDGGHVVHPQEVRSLVRTFLSVAIEPPPIFDCDEDEDAWLLRINPPLSALLHRYINYDPHESATSNRRDLGGATERFKKAVAHHEAIAVTFDAELARRRPLLELVTTRHVLAVAAREYWEDQARCVLPATRIELPGSVAEAGEGHVFVYALVEEGVSRQARLHTVVILDDGRLAPRAAETVLRWIATSEHPATPIPIGPMSIDDARAMADAGVAQQRDEIQREREERNAAIVAARHVAIETSFAAKERSIQSAIQATNNPAARQMNLGRLRHLQVRRDEKLAELGQRDAVSVSSQLVALGRVRIVPIAMSADAPPVTDVIIDVTPMDAPPGPEQEMTVPAPAGSDHGEVPIWANDTPEPWPGAAETCDAEDAAIDVSEADQPSVAGQEVTLGVESDVPSSEVHLVAVTVPASDTMQVEIAEPRALDQPTPITDLETTITAPASVGSDDNQDTSPEDGVDTDSVRVPDAQIEQPHMRQLRFPEMAAVGPLFARSRTASADWERVGPARGNVGVPADVDVRLRVDRGAAADVSWLASLGPDDLFSLVLDGEALDQSALRIVARLTGLRELSISDTSIGDREIRALEPLGGLASLCLAGCHISNLSVLYLKPLATLQSLDLSRTTIDSGGIVHLPSLTKLEELILAGTNVSDGGLVHLARLPDLRRLDLRGTRTTSVGRRRLSADVEVLSDE